MIKKILFIMIFIFIGLTNYQNEYAFNDNTKPILTEKIDSSEIKWNLLIESIIWVESKNDSTAIGEKRISVGCLQITPIYIKEVNKILDENKFILKDRYSRKKSIDMFNIYQKHKNPTKDINLAIKLHNPKASKHYSDSILTKYNNFIK